MNTYNAPDSQWLTRDALCSWHPFTLRTTDESATASRSGYAGTSSYATDVWSESRDAVLCEAIAQHDPFQVQP